MDRDSDLLLSEEELLKPFRARKAFHVLYKQIISKTHIDPNQTTVKFVNVPQRKSEIEHSLNMELLIVVEQSLCGPRKQLSRCHFWEELKK
ncbi:unnamed protein product [Brassica napus]|uniref:(rape) hypothetical protein n=1 Tax=Brassica napus TaxID=3708 RepID=A0A816X997_BRANA|nr:unnamed protein product [Brassica napus]